MIESESKIRVRYVETDVGGSVHHSKFIPWMEVARVEMFDNLGLPYAGLEKQGIGSVVLEVHLKVIKPAYFDDRLVVKAYVRECPKARLKVEYEIFRDETLLATAETTHAFVNKERKAIRPPKVFFEAVESHF